MHSASKILARQAPVDGDPERQAIRALIRRCLSGDVEASEDFQRAHGELIYNYPVNVYRIGRDQAGDFYVFAFDGGRIYRRLRTYEGRAPFRAYLLGFVLDDLVLEWKRAARGVDMVPLDDADDLPDPADGTTAGSGTAAPGGWLEHAFARQEPAHALLLKLLYIEDWYLTATEIRSLAATSGRSIAEVVRSIEQLRATVRDREAALKSVEDTLGTVQVWTQLFERRLRGIDAELAALPTAKLLAEQSALRRKLERRQRQRSKLLARAKRRQVTAPYRAIAVLFNTTVGNIASQIARARQQLREQGPPADEDAPAARTAAVHMRSHV